VQVVQTNGEFSASLIGSTELRCVRPSRAEAISALQSELAQRIAAGELVNLEISLGVSGLAGAFRDDPELRQICAQIYRDRDSDRPE
jgi:hypothetical protein